MKQIILSRNAYDRYNAILEDVILQLNEYTKGNIIDFEEQGFEDMSGNDICGIDDERVYMDDDFDLEASYPLHELDVLDAIKIMGDFENNIIGATVITK